MHKMRACAPGSFRFGCQRIPARFMYANAKKCRAIIALTFAACLARSTFTNVRALSVIVYVLCAAQLCVRVCVGWPLAHTNAQLRVKQPIDTGADVAGGRREISCSASYANDDVDDRHQADACAYLPHSAGMRATPIHPRRHRRAMCVRTRGYAAFFGGHASVTDRTFTLTVASSPTGGKKDLHQTRRPDKSFTMLMMGVMCVRNQIRSHAA